MIKFIYFDAGGVLFHFKSGLREIARRHNLDYADFEHIFRKYDNQVIKGLITPQKLWEIYQKELDFHEEINFLDYWTSKLDPINETHEFLSQLISTDYQIGLITNLYAGVYEKAIQLGAIPDLNYSIVIQSAVVQMMKPDQNIYELAQLRCGFKGNQILFTDDKPEFLKCPKAMGWRTMLFDEQNPRESINQIRMILKEENDK